MKRVLQYFLFVALLFLNTQQTYAQTSIKLTQSSIVKDSTGKIYPQNVWQTLFDAGTHGLLPIDTNDVNTEFLIVRIDDPGNSLAPEFSRKPPETSFFKTGKTISNFSTKDIDGNKIKLSELEGKIVVINFWFINCPPCRKEIPELNALVEDFKDSSNIVFIGVALDEQYELQRFLKSTPFNYQIIDRGKFISGKYGIRMYPTNLVLDREGKVYFHSAGYTPNTVAWIRKSVAELW